MVSVLAAAVVSVEAAVAVEEAVVVSALDDLAHAASSTVMPTPPNALSAPRRVSSTGERRPGTAAGPGVADGFHADEYDEARLTGSSLLPWNFR